jgi:carbamate kinase
VVDPRDVALADPGRQVGAFSAEAEAREMMLEEDLIVREDAGRGRRRGAPSPEPLEIIEIEAIRDHVDDGVVVVHTGCVPVVRSRGALRRIDAVIDEDLVAALLARGLGADTLLILTDELKACMHFGTPEQEALGAVTASQMRACAAEDHFKAGSMGPKVEACLRFAEAGGEAVIASLTEVEAAMAGKASMHILPDEAARRGAERPACSAFAQRAAAPKKAAAPKAAASAAMSDAGAGGNGERAEARRIVAQIVYSAGRPRFPFDEKAG